MRKSAGTPRRRTLSVDSLEPRDLMTGLAGIAPPLPSPSPHAIAAAEYAARTSFRAATADRDLAQAVAVATRPAGGAESERNEYRSPVTVHHIPLPSTPLSAAPSLARSDSALVPLTVHESSASPLVIRTSRPLRVFGVGGSDLLDDPTRPMGIPAVPETAVPPLEAPSGYSGDEAHPAHSTMILGAAPSSAVQGAEQARDASPARADEGTAPQRAGLIADFLPFDRSTLSAALSRFFDRLDGSAADGDEGRGDAGPSRQALALAAGLVILEFGRRWLRRRSRPAALSLGRCGDDRPHSRRFSELPGPWFPSF